MINSVYSLRPNYSVEVVERIVRTILQPRQVKGFRMSRSSFTKTNVSVKYANGICNNNGKDLKNTNSNYTLKIVFISLLLDLLAFTMILPLLPSLMEHYRSNDDANGLYPWLLNKVEYFRTICGAPERFNSVLFGGKFNLIYCDTFILYSGLSR